MRFVGSLEGDALALSLKGDALAHGIRQMANDGRAFEKRLTRRGAGERLSEEITNAHDLVVDPEHVFFERLAALRICMSKEIADHTVIAIER